MEYELIVLGNTLSAWQATAEAAWKGLRVALVTGSPVDSEHPSLDGHDLLAHAQSLVNQAAFEEDDQASSSILAMPLQRWQRFQQQLRRTALRELRGTLDWLEIMHVPVYKTTFNFRDHRHLHLNDRSMPTITGERYLLAHSSSTLPSSSWTLLLQMLASNAIRQSKLRSALVTLEDLFQTEMPILPTLLTREPNHVQRFAWLKEIMPDLSIVAADEIRCILSRVDDPSYPYLTITRDRREIPVSRFLVEGERHVNWTSCNLAQADIMADDRGMLWSDPRQQTTNPSVYALPHLASSFTDLTLSMPQLINQLCLELHRQTPRPHLFESKSIIPR